MKAKLISMLPYVAMAALLTCIFVAGIFYGMTLVPPKILIARLPRLAA